MAKSMAKFNPISGTTIGVVVVAAALAYFGWCAFNYQQTTEWSWAPWKYLNLGAPQPDQGGQNVGQ